MQSLLEPWFKTFFFSRFFNVISDIWNFCEFGVLGPSVHNNVGVHLESKKSKCSDEFLWPLEFPGTLPALGADGIFTSAGKFHHHRSFRYLSQFSAIYCGE